MTTRILANLRARFMLTLVVTEFILNDSTKKHNSSKIHCESYSKYVGLSDTTRRFYYVQKATIRTKSRYIWSYYVAYKTWSRYEISSWIICLFVTLLFPWRFLVCLGLQAVSHACSILTNVKSTGKIWTSYYLLYTVDFYTIHT